jgi:hypothetical protein
MHDRVTARAVDTGGHGRSRLLMVSLGIVLFILGFMLTIAAIPHAGQNEASGTSGSYGGGEPGSSSDFYLMSGMVVSLAGVVLATVGPAMGFVKRTSRD